MSILLGVALLIVQAATPRSWDDVVLPRGFRLVPATAEVTNGAARRASSWFTYEAGVLACRGEGLELFELPEAPPAPVGEAAAELTGPFDPPPADGGAREVAPERGDAFLFRSSGGADEVDTIWGYLRVLDVQPEHAELELVRADGAAPLRREPPVVRAAEDEGAIRLEWDAVDAGAVYRVVRRYHDGAGYRRETFAVTGGELVDAAPELEGRLVEYAIARARDNGPEFGARVRAAAPLWSPAEPLPLRRGQFISMLCGETNASLADLQVETVSSSGAQVAVARGSRLWSLTGPPSRTWILPDRPGQGYESPRLYLQVGREAVCATADGLFARLSIESVEGEMHMRRWIDPSGGRLLPRAPRVIDWTFLESGALRFELSELNRELEELEGVLLTPIAELESPYDGGTWIEVGTGQPGAFELVHPVSGPVRAERFRFRYALNAFVRSPPSRPVVAVVGDDRGPVVAAGLAAALADLTSPEFERRRTAAQLIDALGSRAWPALREALASDDPALAAAATELLDRAGASASDEGATGAANEAPDLPFALRIAPEAERRGVRSPLPAGLGDDPLSRAWTLLRESAPGSDEANALGEWLPVLASGDPDPGVRRLAETLDEGREDPWLERAFWRRVDTSAATDPFERLPLELQVEEWSRFFADGPSVLSAIGVLSEAIDLARPRASEVLLKSLWDLTFAQRMDEPQQRAALSRAQLGLLLQAQAELQDDAVFLDAAARLAPSHAELAPGALRMRALRDLAWLWGRHAAAAGPLEPLEVRLEEASLAALRSELEILAEEPPEGGVVLRLPAGRYADETGRNAGLLIAVDGLRLVGEGECVIEVPLRASDVRGVVVENLTVTTATTTAVSLFRASLRAEGCAFSASNTVVQVNESDFSASGCEFGPQADRAGSYAVRSTGASLVLLDGCIAQGCATGVSVAGTAYLERCVVTGGTRSALECPTGEGELYLLDVYVHAEGSAFGRLDRAAVDGLIVASANSVNLGAEVVVCPERLHLLVELAREPSGFVARCIFE